MGFGGRIGWRRIRPGRPNRTHCDDAETCFSLSFVLGGISRSSARRTAEIKRLFSGWPGTIAGPRSPPWSIASRESSRSPDYCFFGPWQARHWLANSGRTSFSKNSGAAGSGAPPPAAAGEAGSERPTSDNAWCSPNDDIKPG